MGFDVLDELIERHNIPRGGMGLKGMYGKGIIAGQRVMLMKPMTYMNLSGEAVRAYADYYHIDIEEELIVIYDDIDLDIGKIRVKKQGSAGSHNGMKNIVQHLGRTDFTRIRVGIGARPEKWDLADYVLAPFSKDDRVNVDIAIKEAADAVEMILAGDLDRAMEKYNRKEKKKKPKKEAAEEAADTGETQNEGA